MNRKWFDDLIRLLVNIQLEDPDPTAEGKFGLVSCRMDYFILMSSKVKHKIINIDGFIPVDKYPYPEVARPDEIGSISYFRICLSDTYDTSEMNIIIVNCWTKHD